MGLREALLEMQAANEMTGAAAQSAQNLRQQVERERLAEQLRSGQQVAPQEIAAGASLSGNQTPINLLMSGMSKSSKEGEAFTPEQLKAAGLSDEEVQLAASIKSPSRQQTFITDIQKKNKRNLEESEAGRRGQEIGRKQGEQFRKIEKEFADTDKTYSMVQDVLAKKELSVPEQGLVFNFLARNVAGEKGPLSDQDVARYSARTGIGSMEQLKNYMSGDAKMTLSPQQKIALKDMFTEASGRYTELKQKVVANNLNDQIAENPRLLDKDGKPVSSIMSKASRQGMSWDDKAGAFVVNKKPVQETGFYADVVKSGGIKFLQNIKALEAKKGRALTEEEKAQALNTIKQRGGM